MDQTTKDKWISELRSGKHRRAKSKLEADGAYCPLGLLLLVDGRPIVDENRSEDPAYAWLAEVLYPIDVSAVYQMNDSGDLSFEEMAAWVEAHVPVDAPA